MSKLHCLSFIVLSLLAACGGSPPPEPIASQTGDQVEAPADETPAEGRSCGGFTLPNTPGCTETEYCEFEVEAHCGAADQAGICRPRPEMCTREYMPVCGCDGRTYPNRCTAAAAGTGVTALEPCPEGEGAGATP